jgi:hypothetical protein
MKAELVTKALEEAQEHYTLVGVPATLRELFYRLASKGVIALTKNDYKKLSDALAKARYRGEFPWHLIKDTSRQSPRWLEERTYYPTKPLSGDDLKKVLEDYVDKYSDVSINPWEDQRFRVFVVVEKDSLLDTVEAAVRRAFPFGVFQVRSIRGYDSATDIYNLALELGLVPEGQRPVILQVGDFDPTGEDIVRDFRERLMMLSHRKDIVFEKVAVTIDQVVDLDLPCKPEKMEEIQKLRRDARYGKHVAKIKELAEGNPKVRALVERYGTHEVRVEVEAMTGLRPKEFEEALRKAIERYFDHDVYEKVTKPKIEELKRKAEEVKAASLEALKKLLKMW